MKPGFIRRVRSVICSLGLAVLVGALFCLPGQANAEPSTPHVTVFVKNLHAEYDISTAQFLERQFEYADSPAYGLVTYTVTTTLTSEALAGSAALVIDASADMSLTDAEAAVIHSFVRQGGRVGLFTFPRYYWDHEGANPAAYQGIADLWGISAVGEPAASELASGHSSANVAEPEDATIAFTGPYTVTGQIAETFDQLPFSPITASAAKPVLVSAALGQLPAAVANEHGIFVTNPIGDAVQGGDANQVYGQFVTDAIVWLTTGGPLLPHQLYLPLTLR